ncbi:MAG: glycosyltransferase family 4 protein [Candidatus Omnitrophica bacterium]|nr:glycosyltransferase family 4 protein [Candidatus Omnitrophota bacterium]
MVEYLDKAKRTNILFIITYLELGGAQKQLLTIVKGLPSQDYSLTVCAGKGGYLTDKFLKLPNIKVKIIPYLVREINIFYDILAFLKLFSFIRRNRFDIVHTHSPKASFLGRWAAYFAGVKNIVYTVHGWPFHSFLDKFTYYFYLFLEKLTARITKKIVVVSEIDLSIGIEKVVANKSKFTLIHYGIDEREKWESVFIRREKLSSSDLIVNISSLKMQKGIYDFITMAKIILKTKPNLKFMILGDGYLRKDVERKIKVSNLNGKIILTGWVEDISDILEKCAVCVLTSLWEGLPLVVVECIFAGVPMVVTETGGIKDIFNNNEQGIIVKPKDIEGLYKGVLEILDNYPYWQRKVRDKRKIVDLSYWCKERMLEEIKSLYQNLPV